MNLLLFTDPPPQCGVHGEWCAVPSLLMIAIPNHHKDQILWESEASTEKLLVGKNYFF